MAASGDIGSTVATSQACQEQQSLAFPPMNLPQTDIPLVVGLDGGLIKSGIVSESALAIVRAQPLTVLWAIVASLVEGRAELKHVVTKYADIDIGGLPIRNDFAAWVENEHKLGRRVILATAADEVMVAKVAARFPFIDEIVSFDSTRIRKDSFKAGVLQDRFPQGFIYAANFGSDLKVCSNSINVVLVGPSRSVEFQAATICEPLAVFPLERPTFTTYRRAFRVHQWAKNALVFVPLVLGGKFADLSAWEHALAGFIAFCLLASSAYIVNDLWDLADDRRHWSKHQRPIAAGLLPIPQAILFALFGIASSFSIAAWASPNALLVLALYLVLTLGYSFRLKREPVIDVLVLASLFTIRLALGVVLTSTRFAPWLFVFSIFLFISLSLAKRFTEISRTIEKNDDSIFGRGYLPSDAPLILALGISSMTGAILVMAVYLVSDAFPAGFYRTPALLWFFPVVLFMWLGRIWLLCHRGQLYDDPVAFALKDKISIGYGAIMIVIFISAVVLSI